ncbi:glutamate-cysteine ligase family protein [Ruminococcus albus]|uniref:glutamate--cysteine ligase n=1 Tax=Ruminococcus albus TaxID=1264 RepID=A0A1I1JI52_RUMAL|nr:glutamate-cysteine ligase family protein [Ruminococcus albus]SFC47642.1 Gamma-glutamylcysteine synthetase [Ruminococcus albus]
MKIYDLDEALYNKYIAPTKKDRGASIGIEIEMPVVDISGKAVDEATVLSIADRFREHFRFEITNSDDNGNVNSMTHEETGDNLSFDCSYSNLELSMGKSDDLNILHKRFLKYYNYLQELFRPFGYTLTGMGINPHYNINTNRPVPNERYRMLYHYLHSYRRYEGDIGRHFHDRPDFGTFTSASQVQLDVSHDDLIETLNVFTLLEPYKALLFANSYLPEFPDYLCARNMLWEHSMQGYNPHNIGMFTDKLHSVDELIEYIKSQSIYCTMRDGKYIDFKPVSVRDYFELEKVSGEYFDGSSYRSTTFSPECCDLQYLRTFKFEDLTFRGTIEYRSSCCQPISDVMTVAAFHTGLSIKLDELKELLDKDRVIYSHGYSPAELQDMLSKRELPKFLDRDGLRSQLEAILDIAASGLKERAKNEEHFLAPLYDRAEKLTNPAKEMLEGLEQGIPMTQFIEKYSRI